MANDEVRIKIKIDSNSQELVLMKQQVQDLGKSFTDADSFANTFMKRINLAGHIYAGFQILNNTLGDLGRRGLEVNKEFQKLTNSLTMSSAVMMANNDIYGNAITVTEKYQIAQIDAAKTTEMLQKININTPHTMKETTQIYDSMYFGMKKVGATTKDMVEITEKLSIAAGNKVPFDAFLSAMDGISTGTVEANSEMGRFLTSVGLSNDEIKNSTNVVQLFKDKLSGFQVIQDFDTKMSNLTNSTDMFAKNLMKIPFDYLESKLPTTARMFDAWAKSINEINIYLSDASNLKTYDELINKQYQLLGQISEVKNDKFMWDSDQKEKLSSLNGELETVFKKLSKIRELEDKAKNIETKFDSKPIDDLVEKTLNPYGAKLDEINKKWQNNFEDMQKNGRDTSKVYAAWNKDISDLDKEEADKKEKLLKENEKLLKDQQKIVEDTQKAYLETAQIGMGEYEKALLNIDQRLQEWKKSGVDVNEILRVQTVLITELNSKTLFETQKEDLSFFERKIQLMDDSISKELELQGISYASRILEIENSTKSIAEKDKLIAKETELFNLIVQTTNYKYDTEFQETMSNFYDDMLDSQIALNNAVFDFGAGFDGASSKIGAVSKSLAAMGTLELTNKREASKLDKKYIEQFNKYAGDVEKTKLLEQQYTKDTLILNEQNIQAQMAGYANIAGALSGMFEEGSRDAATFQLVESSLALATGIRAILTQGSGDPYTAFARMASMAAIVSQMLGNIGVVFGMNKTTVSSDSFSSMTANDGSGTILGDSKAQSESISNSLGILQDFAKPEFELLGQMNKYLASIDQKIGGVSSLLIQNGGFAFGEGFTPFSSGYKNDLLTSKGAFALQPINGLLSKIPVIGQINALGGDILNSVIGGLFGKTSVSQSLKDSGIYFANQLLTQAIKDFDGSAYQTISTTISKKSWFSKSSSTSINSYFDALDSETERQFSLVLGNLYNTVLSAGEALDSTEAQTAAKLKNYVISVGKISLKDKTGTEIQELLTNVFGKIGDDLTESAFNTYGTIRKRIESGKIINGYKERITVTQRGVTGNLLTPFQQVGEGLFETLTRVATGMETAEFYIGRLGNKFTDITFNSIKNKQGDVGFEALFQSIEKFDKATYGANNNLLKIINSLDSTAEELYTVYTTLDELRDKLIFIGQSAQGISSSMIYGAGSIDALSGGFNSYFENFLNTNEQLDYKTEQLTQKFKNLGLALPTSNIAFKTLLSSLDLTSKSGQELYGRLITLSDSFAEISSLRVNALQDELDITNGTISNIKEISTSLDNVITSLRSGLDNSSTNLLEKFNKSMANSLLIASTTNDYTALASSIKDTINYSSVLNNSDYFGTLRDMQYAQSVAANQFESININLDDELSVLQTIASNTNEMIAALSNLTTAVKSLQESSATTASNTAQSRYIS